jgi:hypothetical protein
MIALLSLTLGLLVFLTAKEIFCPLLAPTQITPKNISPKCGTFFVSK